MSPNMVLAQVAHRSDGHGAWPDMERWQEDWLLHL